jgi:sulfoxide reductase heme-binding subunit YedZ
VIDQLRKLANDVADGPVLWFANRGTGVILVILLTLATALGVLSTARMGSTAWPRFATQVLHRNVSLLSAVMLGVHAATAVIDTYVDIRWYDVFVPFAATYQPLWMALGAIALDVIVVVAVTGLLRRRLSLGVWRGIHLLSYLGWAVGVVHGIGIGTDRATIWGIAVTVGSVTVVLITVIVRLVTLQHEHRLAA